MASKTLEPPTQKPSEKTRNPQYKGMSWSKGLARAATVDVIDTILDINADFFTLSEGLHLDAHIVQNHFNGNLHDFSRDWLQTGTKALALDRPLRGLSLAHSPHRLISAEVRYKHRVSATKEIPAWEETRALPMFIIPDQHRRRLQNAMLQLRDANLNYAQRFCRSAIRWLLKEEDLILEVQEKNLQRILCAATNARPIQTVGLNAENYALRHLGLETQGLILGAASIEQLVAALTACAATITHAKKDDLPYLVNSAPLNQIFEGIEDEDYNGIDLKFIPAKFNFLKVRAELAPQFNLLETLALADHKLQPSAAEFAKTIEALKAIELDVTRDQNLDDLELNLDEALWTFR